MRYDVSSNSLYVFCSIVLFSDLRFRIGGKYMAERHMFLKKDPSKENSIIVSNIPAFVGEVS